MSTRKKVVGRCKSKRSLAQKASPRHSHPSFLTHTRRPGVGSTATDRQALVALFEATNGRSWEHTKGWCTSANIEDWYGVTVNKHGRVVELRLSKNKMQGKPPTQTRGLGSGYFPTTPTPFYRTSRILLFILSNNFLPILHKKRGFFYERV